MEHKKRTEQPAVDWAEEIRARGNDTSLIQSNTSNLTSAYLAEETYWKEISHLLWLNLGDHNTGFVRSITKACKRANSFSVLEDNKGNMVSKEDEIAKIIVSYFNDLFTSKDGTRAETVQYPLKKVGSQE